MLTMFAWSLVLGMLSSWINPVSAFADSRSQPWTTCLITAAKEVEIPENLFHAIVDVESGGHPWIFGVKQRNGTWTSRSFEDRETAEQFLRRLWDSETQFDMGLAQINRANLQRFWTTHGISPSDALDPCTNLRLAALVLREQIDKHGYTWRAIAGYNGSLSYIPKVWEAFCRLEQTAGCSR